MFFIMLKQIWYLLHICLHLLLQNIEKVRTKKHFWLFYTPPEVHDPPFWGRQFDVSHSGLLLLSGGLTPWSSQSIQRGQTTEGALHTERMKAFHWILLYCAAPLLSDVQGTYHLMRGDPELMAAQSYAQTRNNGHPPLRTLNPASKFNF